MANGSPKEDLAAERKWFIAGPSFKELLALAESCRERAIHGFGIRGGWIGYAGMGDAACFSFTSKPSSRAFFLNAFTCCSRTRVW